MSNRICTACNVLSPREHMLVFTENKAKRKKWVDGIAGTNDVLREQLLESLRTARQPYICRSHFSEDDYHINGSLKHTAIPTMENSTAQYLTKESKHVKMEYMDENMNYKCEENSTELDEPSTADSYSHRGSITGDMLNYKTQLVDNESLLELLKLCPYCHQECDIRTVVEGACLKVSRKCECAQGSRIPMWCSSKTIHTKSSGGKEQLREVNLDLCCCVLSSGSTYKGMERFFLAMECPFISERTYHRHKSHYVKDAIECMYQEQHFEIMAIISDYIRKGEHVNLYGDGQYDSRGFSAMVCRYIIMESAHNFILEATVLRKKRGESSARLEPLAHKQALKKVLNELKDLTGNSSPIKSFTSDRHKIIAKNMQSEFPTVSHKYDAWHFFRNVTMDILKAKKLKLFEPLADWSRSIINHMWYSVGKADGNGVLAREIYMSVLEHIQGRHQFRESSLSTAMPFTQYTACPHGQNHPAAYLDANNLKHKKALRRLDGILTAGQRLHDIESVSPVFATSQVESANALHMCYANKSLFFSEEGFSIRSKLSIIHWNMMKLDEHIHKVRTTIGTKTRYCKTRNQVVSKSIKTAPDNTWRIELKLRARQVREEMEYVPTRPLLPLESSGDLDDELEEDDDAIDELDDATALNQAHRMWQRSSADLEDQEEMDSDYSDEL